MTSPRGRSQPAGSTLEQLYSRHHGKVSDKWSAYLTEYGRLLAEHRDRPVRLLEIGVQNGGSLEIWAKFFPKARAIVGCDIDPRCAQLTYDDPRISVVIGDAGSDRTRDAILGISPEFDIVIDDGSHRSSDIVKAFAAYFPRLSNGGLYLVEDLHCSYWGEFEGGLFHPFSSMAFFKRLADAVNHEHWGVPRSRGEVLEGFFREYGSRISEGGLEGIHSIHFGNSMCAVRKERPEANKLSARVVAGSREVVQSGHPELNATTSPPRDESANEWATRPMPPDQELPLRLQELTERDGRIGTLEGAVAERDGRIGILEGAVAERDGRIGALEMDVTERDRRIAALDEVVRDRDGKIAAGERALAEGRERQQELERAVALRDAELVKRDDAVAARDARITALEQELASAREQVRQLEGAVASRDAEARELSRRLSSLDARVAAVYASHSWRFTEPLRRVSLALRRLFG